MSIAKPDRLEIAAGPFAADPEWLATYTCPEWFRDAKFGIWSHWGPQCVPMYGDWYARNMYVEGSDQYRHHWRVYGHPSKHGYKDIIPLWRAERFDPNALMSLYAEAGAKYFVGQAMHHDNFDNFDSAHQPRWNSVATGPKKDICRMWQEAARAKGLPFGLSEHLGASYHWMQHSKGADKSGPFAGVPYQGIEAEDADLYYEHDGPGGDGFEWLVQRWYTENDGFHRHWFHRIKDVIDKFHPDLLYSDGGVPFGEFGRSIIAHLYNTSVADHGENRAVYNHKDAAPEVSCFGVLDLERGQLDQIAERPWQTDTSVGDWYYNVRDVYKSPLQVIETLVDIVSKNGNLLLNIPQLPDGTLDDECAFLLRQVAVWMKANGEGIFDSRPWTVAGEGPTRPAGGAFKESASTWTPQDFRFTQSKAGDTVYAYQMERSPEAQAIIHALGADRARRVRQVRVLGRGSVRFEQDKASLTIQIPNSETVVGPLGFAVAVE